MSEITARPYRKDYEITDAMFGAFRSPGGMGLFWRLLGWTTLLYTVLYVLVLPSIVRGYVNMFAGIGDLDPTDVEAAEAVSDQINSAMLDMLPSLLVLMIGSIVILAVVRAAFYRSYFHNETVRGFPFRLGADEGRQLLAQTGYWGLLLVFYILFAIVVGLVAALIGFGVGASGGDGVGGMVLLGLIVVLAYIGIFVLLAWYLVRFAPAAALTGLRRKTHVFAARHVSKNRFWALFGALLVALIFGYVASYAAMLMGGMIGASGLVDGNLLEQLMGDDASSVIESVGAKTQTTSFRIKAFIGTVLLCLGTAFYTLMIMGPSAFFVRQWDEMDPSRAFD